MDAETNAANQYGIIKKIEHFWKGLSSDRTQISALPPDEYGDRFYNFIEGITMSAEEGRREAQRKDQEAIAAQASEQTWHQNTMHKSHHGVPPMPDHQPPAPPGGGTVSPEGRETLEMASREARRSIAHGASEQDVPDRTLRTGSMASDKRDSMQHESILPVVEEVGECSRVAEQGTSRATGANGKMPVPPPPSGPPPPTPPKSQAQLKVESSDSGYGGNSNGTISRDSSLRVRPQLSKESLNKGLPPLPSEKKQNGGGVRMVA